MESHSSIQSTINQIKAQMELDFIGVALIQPKQGFEMRWVYVSGNFSDRYKRIVLQSGKGIAGMIFKTGKPIHVQNLDETHYINDLFNYPIIVAERLKSFAALPLYKGLRVEGVLLGGFRTNNQMTESLFNELTDHSHMFFHAFNDGKVK